MHTAIATWIAGTAPSMRPLHGHGVRGPSAADRSVPVVQTILERTRLSAIFRDSAGFRGGVGAGIERSHQTGVLAMEG